MNIFEKAFKTMFAKKDVHPRVGKNYFLVTEWRALGYDTKKEALLHLAMYVAKADQHKWHLYKKINAIK